MIEERQQNLDNTEKLMKDIKDIAGTIQTNTRAQGEVLMRTDQNVDVAKDNAEAAHKEIEEAQTHQKSGSKWLCYILGVLGGLGVIVVIIIIAKTA